MIEAGMKTSKQEKVSEPIISVDDESDLIQNKLRKMIYESKSIEIEEKGLII